MLPALLLTAALAPADAPPTRPILDELLKDGLAIPGGPRVKLKAPAMPDGPPANQAKALETFAEDFPPGLFVRRSLRAPYKLIIRDLMGDNGKRRGHTLDLWFIAHGKIAQVEKDNVIDDLLGLRARDKKTTFLTEKELETRKIKLVTAPGLTERYSLLDAPLVEKVQLNGVLRSQRQTGKRSVSSAALLDPRFADDKEHPNRWRPITVVAGGGTELGKPHPYTGFGGYAKITELTEPEGALFIELHFVFHEPHDWFGGFNVLASKLPLVVRDNVHNLRRKLGAK